MEGGVLTDYIIPSCLALMMVGLGMTLTIDDFKRVAVYPKATALGVVFQIICLPLVGFALASVFPLTQELAVGVMLLAACPGGVASNIITHLAKGDTALAVTLTIISSAISLITIPLIVSLSLTRFMGVNSEVSLPILDTILKVFALTVPTVITGMIIKAKAENFAAKTERIVNLGGLFFLIFLIVGVAISERETIFGEALNVGPVTLTLCVLTTILSYLGARAFSISVAGSVSVAICTGFQNSALALVIATSFLKNAQIAIAPAVYTVVMYATAGAIVGYMNLRGPLEDRDDEPSVLDVELDEG